MRSTNQLGRLRTEALEERLDKAPKFAGDQFRNALVFFTSVFARVF